MDRYDLWKLPDFVQSISRNQVLFYVEACIAALKSQSHHSGVLLNVEGAFRFEKQIV